MQFHNPEPDYTNSARTRANLRLAFKLALGFVMLLWLVHLADWLLALDLGRFGVQPRALAGLSGVFWAPLLHDGFGHLIANSMPLLVLGTGVLYLYPHSALKVIPIIYLGAGLAVWLLGRPASHIGASGLVYGLAAYIFVAGILRRDARAIAASLLVYFLYGTMVWGVLPIEQGVSWETHLAAAVLGVLLAFRYRRLDVPPRKRYAWEDEEEDDEWMR